MKEHYLSEEDYKKLVLNIENPPEPTEALEELIKKEKDEQM